MDRRSFIKLLTSAAAAVGLSYAVGDTLDPLIVEEAAKESGLTTSEIIAKELELIRPQIVALFERDDTFFKALETRPVEVKSLRDMRVLLEIKPGRKS